MRGGAQLGTTVALGLTMYVVSSSQTLLVPALPQFQEELGTTPVGATSLISVFFVAGAIACGTVGRLADMFGKRRLMLVLVALYTIGSLVCLIGSSLALLLVGRAIAGVAVGVQPLTFAILRDEFSPRAVRTLLPLTGGVAASGGALGQISGGFIADGLGTDWIFWISAGAGLVSLVAIAIAVPASRIVSPGKVDVVGATLLSLGLGAALIAISRASTWGWSSRNTVSLLVVGFAVLTVFFAYERRCASPIVHVPTFVQPVVRLTNLATLMLAASTFSMPIICSQFLQVPESTGFGLGLSSTQAGLLFAPGLLLMLLEAPLAGRLTHRHGARTTLLLGALVSVVAIGGLTVAHGNVPLVLLWVSLMFLSMGLTFGAMPQLIFDSVPSTRSGEAASINIVVRNAGASIGIQLAATFVTASALANGLPTEGGYTTAFVVAACAAVAAVGIAALIPVRGRATAGARGQPAAVEATGD
jgi:MFS family permease